MNITLALVGNNMTEQKQKFNYGSRTIFIILFIFYTQRQIFVPSNFQMPFKPDRYPVNRAHLQVDIEPARILEKGVDGLPVNAEGI